MDEKVFDLDLEKVIKGKSFQLFIKRIFDIILSIIGIIILSPILLLIFILIKLDSKGPAIFKQVRIGKDGVSFKIYKFRTMVVNAEKLQKLELKIEDIENFVFQSKEDNRITKIGSFLRKSSLDELPQLFNVLFGSMSLVGPRPEIEDVVKFYPENYRKRLLALPGITGLAQISGRGEIELKKTVYYDLLYISRFSVFYDIEILFRTVISVFKKDGAF
jgi:lipopolysaccharide/colanic/teichoic acid biosynthesis glycosyltransferase